MAAAFLIVAAITISLWVFWAANAPDIALRWGRGDLSRAASWGDGFGAFNALFGSLGFAAIVATLLMQAQAMRSQQDDQHRQRFDASFFELLRLLREQKGEVRFKYSEVCAKARGIGESTLQHGADAFRTAVREMKYWIFQERRNQSLLSQHELGKIYTQRIHRRFEARLSPYFRLLYTIMEMIKSDPNLPEYEKLRYSRILRSQLTSFELQLIAFNALAPVAKDLSDYLEHFRMLKYMPIGSVRKALLAVYKPEAFSPRD